MPSFISISLYFVSYIFIHLLILHYFEKRKTKAYKKTYFPSKQGRIHGSPVADSSAGAVLLDSKKKPHPILSGRTRKTNDLNIFLLK